MVHMLEDKGDMNEIESARGKDARSEVFASNLQRRAERFGVSLVGDRDEFRMDVDGYDAFRGDRIHVLQTIPRGAAEHGQACGTNRAVDVGEDGAERSELIRVVRTHMAFVVLRRDVQPLVHLAAAHGSVPLSRLARLRTENMHLARSNVHALRSLPEAELVAPPYRVALHMKECFCR